MYQISTPKGQERGFKCNMLLTLGSKKSMFIECLNLNHLLHFLP